MLLVIRWVWELFYKCPAPSPLQYSFRADEHEDEEVCEDVDTILTFVSIIRSVLTLSILRTGSSPD